MYKVIKVTFWVLVVLITSCQSDSFSPVKEVEQKIELIDFYRSHFMNDKVDTYVNIQNYQANFIADLWGENNYASVVCGGKDNGLCEANKLEVDEITFVFDQGSTIVQSDEYKQIFGKRVNLSYAGQEVDGRNDSEDNIYVPDILEVSIGEQPVLVNGYPITWNADQDNTSGVYIVVEYSPLENMHLRAQYSDSEFAYINVPDNGVYDFSKSDFSNVPDGSTVVLRIIRGAFTISDFEEEAVSFSALTHVGGFAKIPS